jgi:hypothetical protein
MLRWRGNGARLSWVRHFFRRRAQACNPQTARQLHHRASRSASATLATTGTRTCRTRRCPGWVRCCMRRSCRPTATRSRACCGAAPGRSRTTATWMDSNLRATIYISPPARPTANGRPVRSDCSDSGAHRALRRFQCHPVERRIQVRALFDAAPLRHPRIPVRHRPPERDRHRAPDDGRTVACLRAGRTDNIRQPRPTQRHRPPPTHADQLLTILPKQRRSSMAISEINVRNRFRGKIKQIIAGPVVAEVDVETAHGIVTSVITSRWSSRPRCRSQKWDSPVMRIFHIHS